MISPAFSERSLHMFEPVLSAQINTFLQQLYLSDSAPVNLTERSQWLAMDVAGQLGFGFPFNLQTEEKYRFITKGLTFINFRVNSYMNFPFLSNLGFDFLLHKSTLRLKWRNLIERMITTRTAQDRKAKHDFYMFVTEQLGDSSEQLQNSELFSESLFFMSAGMS
jgi:cytochrome P450